MERVCPSKRVLAISDLVGVGRAGLMPVLSTLTMDGHQAVPLPTALFSTHMGLEAWRKQDTTEWLAQAIDQYHMHKLQFDALYIGLLGDIEQAELVSKAARTLCVPDAICLLDPVMGDGGRCYQSCTPALCDKLRGLCTEATWMTPNATEAALLLDRPLSERPRTFAQAQSWVYELHKRFGAWVVLTGVEETPEEIGTVCLGQEGVSVHCHAKTAGGYPGTGDLFAGTLLGGLLHGLSAQQACARAGEYVAQCVAHTAQNNAPPLLGVYYEGRCPNTVSQGNLS